MGLVICLCQYLLLEAETQPSVVNIRLSEHYVMSPKVEMTGWYGKTDTCDYVVRNKS